MRVTKVILQSPSDIQFRRVLLLGCKYDIQIVRIVEHPVHEVLDVSRRHVLDNVLEISRIVVVYIIDIICGDDRHPV